MVLSDITVARPSGHILTVALVVTFAMAATILAVWAFERAGYTPCELCLLERKPFYIGIPVGLLTAFAVQIGRPRWAALGFALLALLLAVSVVLAAYHAGVEWKFWAGPTGCSGSVEKAAGINDFLKQLNSVKVVRCDAPALVVLGLSLAGWNAVVSLVLLVLSGFGLRSAMASP
jgi:disulfide bond formation protein DsbB